MIIKTKDRNRLALDSIDKHSERKNAESRYDSTSESLILGKSKPEIEKSFKALEKNLEK